MKILTVCSEGNNRSVHFAHLLKYKYKADVIPIGIKNTSNETLDMLFSWADRIILTSPEQQMTIPEVYFPKIHVWDVGPDTYHRPFNPKLLEMVKAFIERDPL